MLVGLIFLAESKRVRKYLLLVLMPWKWEVLGSELGREGSKTRRELNDETNKERRKH